MWWTSVFCSHLIVLCTALIPKRIIQYVFPDYLQGMGADNLNWRKLCFCVIFLFRLKSLKCNDIKAIVQVRMPRNSWDSVRLLWYYHRRCYLLVCFGYSIIVSRLGREEIAIIITQVANLCHSLFLRIQGRMNMNTSSPGQCKIRVHMGQDYSRCDLGNKVN